MATKTVTLSKAVMAKDQKNAEFIREDFARRGVLIMNMIGSPGAGKTTLLEQTLRRSNLRIGVLEGDIATDRDAARIDAAGAPAVQINTEGGCHLEAHLVRQALTELPVDDLDVIIIENVGNLVCPSNFDLGEDMKVAVSSIPEGEDKPIKYPSLFRQARGVVLTKVDLAPHTAFSKENFWEDVEKLNPRALRFEVSAPKDQGYDAWIAQLETWLQEKRNAR